MEADVAQLTGADPVSVPVPVAHAGDVSPRADTCRTAPLLEPAQGGIAQRFAENVGPGHPVRVFLAAILGGYALLVALTIAAGFLLTRVLLRIDALASADERISRWLERERTPFLVDLSWIGSTLAGGHVIPVVVGTLVVVFLILRHWRLAAFTLFAICVESGTYRATTLVVHRDRPDVERLEGLPVEASFPSGHSAASVALFGGLLLLLASRIENVVLKVSLWVVAFAIPAFVIWSRMLRGMHYATDVTAGALMGVGALVVVVFAARAAGAADAKKGDPVTTTEGIRSS